jgi:addiction module RelE/StbE family toxin
MKIVLHREFKKSFQRLSERYQVKTLEVINLFASNPRDPILKNHALSGRMQGLRSISVTGDYRIIFEERKREILIILLDVGSHEQVYR